jgi:hypothetical protein
MLLPLLVLPFLVGRLRDLRERAAKGAWVALAMTVAALVTAAFSPQSVSTSVVADMRYLVPLILLGAASSAVAFSILWRLFKPAAIAVAAIVVFSNLAHLGFAGGYNSFASPKGVQCTLCRYVVEALSSRTTSTEALVEYIERLPKEDVLLVIPSYMAYSPMYYLPDRRFCCQLSGSHPLRPGLGARLPDYVFRDRAKVDVALINSPRPVDPEGPLIVAGHDMGRYRYRDSLDIPARDCSRPEIPWHAFDPAEEKSERYFPFIVVGVDSGSAPP